MEKCKVVKNNSLHYFYNSNTAASWLTAFRRFYIGK